jgi:two-component sensor histidine kinase
MRKILHSRLPQRWAHRVSPVLVEVAVGIVAALVMVYLRTLLAGFTSERAPYALNFLAVVLATLIAGWRSGLLALVIAQGLVWYFIVPPTWSFAIQGTERIGGLAIATFSQGIILLILGLYQREIDKGVAERERRMELQEQALREIDHRTRNNYSTVLALIQLQAQRSQDAKVREALQQVADRIQAIAGATERLATNSGDIDRIRLDDHLCGLVQQIERGIARDGIRIECEVDEVSAGADTATSISIVVNELVTNAIKHAFNGEAPGHVRVVGNAAEEFELVVTDNGRGIGATRGARNGLGTRLVESFVRQLGARHEVVSTEEGTTHRLIIPNLG